MTSPRLRNPIGVTYADDLSQVRMPARPGVPPDTAPVVQVGTDDPTIRQSWEEQQSQRADVLADLDRLSSDPRVDQLPDGRATLNRLYQR